MSKRILVDPDLCTGCMICTQVCSLTKNRTCNPSRARLRIIDWEHSGLTVPVVCQDCVEPVCVACCPEAAITQDAESGIVLLDAERCTSCRICMGVCPYGGPILDPVERRVYLCDHCDGSPACVSSCPTGALDYCELGAEERDMRMHYLAQVRGSLVRLTRRAGGGAGSLERSEA